MELSDSVVKGLQTLADPAYLDLKSFSIFTEGAFRSLLSFPSNNVFDYPELMSIDQALLKHCHIAATTFILEGVKQNADRSSICSCLEDLRFDSERVEVFYVLYQKNKTNVEKLLSSIDRCPPHITDVAWRTENGENSGASSELNFSCTLEQLQDLVGKMKDAAKSVERATQL